MTKELDNPVLHVLKIIWASNRDEVFCPFCGADADRPNPRACPTCGKNFGQKGLRHHLRNNLNGLIAIVLEKFDDEVDYSVLAENIQSIAKEDNKAGDQALKLLQNGRKGKNEYLRMIREGGTLSHLYKFKLALAGIDYTQHEYEETVECKVCEVEFPKTQTQEHHISYLHDFTITVCYSCHRKIHHKDGYYDELQPDISKEEAKKLRETGYTEPE